MILPPRSPLLPLAIIVASVSFPATLSAQQAATPLYGAVATGQELPPYLQCVPYARDVSGIEIYGDAYTWWEQAAGRYQRGNTPREGAVMAFTPTDKMALGHVAAVARVIDSRTVLLDHANWSPINGRRGQIERGVKAVDVSENNDWSRVRVWYHPLQALGTTAWPVQGFIYPKGKPKARPQQRWAQATPQPVPPLTTRAQPSRSFLAAFSGGAQQAPARTTSSKPQNLLPQQASYQTARPLPPPRAQAPQTPRRSDVAARAVALYD